MPSPIAKPVFHVVHQLFAEAEQDGAYSDQDYAVPPIPVVAVHRGHFPGVSAPGSRGHGSNRISVSCNNSVTVSWDRTAGGEAGAPGDALHGRDGQDRGPRSGPDGRKDPGKEAQAQTAPGTGMAGMAMRAIHL